jgi:shikimate kinase
LASPSTDPHLILTGLPGSGKSSVGTAVAGRLGREFLDFDDEIERRAGCSVAELFTTRGEPAFRALELDLTRELAASAGMVLAPGGGWAAIPGALELLRPPGVLVYLRASPEVVLNRMGRSRSARPLLSAPDPLAELRKLLAKREGQYLLADHVVDVERIDLQRVISLVTRLAPGSGGR